MFFVVKKCVMNVGILIGQNFTDLPDIQYFKAGDVLQFSQSQVQETVNSVISSGVNVGVTDPVAVNALLQLLHEYPMCIATQMSEVGKTDTVKMKIQLTSTQPISCQPRRYAEEKKTGDKRLCVDHRVLNKITVKDRYPLPHIEDLLSRLARHRVFTNLDLLAGYHQVPMSDESIQYTSFVTQDGQYEYLRMPFGLCNAPAVFQRMINGVLGELRFSKVLCYLDDILIPAPSLEQSLAVLREVLDIFKKNGIDT